MVATSDFSGLVKFRLRFRKRSGDRPNGFARPCFSKLEEIETDRARLRALGSDAVAGWPHGPDDGCDCRKPALGNRQKSDARFWISPR
jgi:hypothetical protein